MLFNFRLLPIEEIPPWGEPDNLNLGWFALSLGEYWMSCGENELLRHSDEAIALFTQQGFNVPPYCDYQVARFYFDIFDMISFILEPVPEFLIPYIEGASAEKWQSQLKRWSEEDFDSIINEERWLELTELASSWIWLRNLDMGYLVSPPKIYFWSYDGTTTIHWNNKSCFIEGVPAWSTLYGSFQLPTTEFINELKSFHNRFIGKMGERVELILSDNVQVEASIDKYLLLREQRRYENIFEKYLQRYYEPSNWDSIYSAIKEIESLVGNN